MAQRNDSYHELQSKKYGKATLKKEKKQLSLLIYGFVSFIILFSISQKGHDFSLDMFITSFGPNGGFNSKAIDYTSYFIVSSVLFLFFLGIVSPKSYAEKIKEKQIKQIKRGGLGSIDKIELDVWLYLDKFYRIIGYPFSTVMLLGIDSEADKEKLYFRFGWLNHLEKVFFKQELIKEDGYKRSKSLSILKKYPEYFSSEKGDKALQSKEFAFTLWLFKSRESMVDLMRIAEGYIIDGRKIEKDGTISGNAKFDKILELPEFEKKVSGINKLDGMRLYNGRDEVCFSHDAMKMMIDEETIRFEAYIRKFAFDSRMIFTRRFKKYSGALREDVHALSYLFPKQQAEYGKKVLLNEKKFGEHLIFVMKCYFRFILWKIMIGKYINLPSGTTVVKMRDYTLRMITESWDENALLSIVAGKNDGSTQGFESDNLVNLFLASFNHYQSGTENSSLERIDRLFNFYDQEFAEEDTNVLAAEVSETLAASAPDDWLARLYSDLDAGEGEAK